MSPIVLSIVNIAMLVGSVQGKRQVSLDDSTAKSLVASSRSASGRGQHASGQTSRGLSDGCDTSGHITNASTNAIANASTGDQSDSGQASMNSGTSMLMHGSLEGLHAGIMGLQRGLNEVRTGLHKNAIVFCSIATVMLLLYMMYVCKLSGCLTVLRGWFLTRMGLAQGTSQESSGQAWARDSTIISTSNAGKSGQERKSVTDTKVTKLSHIGNDLFVASASASSNETVVRRASLLPSLNSSSDSDVKLGFAEDFKIPGTSGDLKTFRWLTIAEAEAKGLPHTRSAIIIDDNADEGLEVADPLMSMFGGGPAGLINPVPAAWDPQSVADMLDHYGVDVSRWSADNLSSLATEAATGKSFLISTESGQLLCVKDIVMVIILIPFTGHVLVSGESMTNDYPPNIEKEPSESIMQAALRCLREKLGVDEECIELLPGIVKAIDEEEHSELQPGLVTLVRKRLMQGVVKSTDNQVLKAIGIDGRTNDLKEAQPAAQFQTYSHSVALKWCWKLIRQLPGLYKHQNWLAPSMVLAEKGTGSVSLKLRPKTLGRQKTRLSMSGRMAEQLQVMMPWSSEAVDALLREHRTTADAFDLSLDELAENLSGNSFYFGHRSSNGELVCVTDRILLRLVSPEGHAVLTHVPDHLRSQGAVQWPSDRRRLDESAWDVARRIARLQLGLEDDCVTIGTVCFEMPCEGDGILERKWVVTAYIPSENVSLCASVHASEL